MTTRQRGGLAVAGIAMLTAAGCGSTVGAEPGYTPVTGGSVQSAPVATPAATGTTDRAAMIGPSASSTTMPAGPASGSDPSQLAGPTVAASSGTIRLGIIVPSGNKTYDPATGTQQQTEDFQAIVPALVADLNRRGGLAGRHVVAVVEPLPGANTVAQAQSQEQAVCTSLTQDAHVFAVIAIGIVRYSAQCYATSHTPLVVRTLADSLDDDMLRSLAPWVISDDSPDLDTIARVLAAGLARRHFLDAHIGIAAPDDPADRRVVSTVLIPALTAAGGTVASRDVAYVQDDLADAVPASSHAVLVWKSDLVDRVIPFDILGAWNFLGAAAHSADFHPHWGLDSTSRPQLALDEGPPIPPPPADERTAVAVGFYPSYDVLDTDYPLRPAERQCLEVVNRAIGTTYEHRAYGQGAAALVTCRTLALLRAALAPERGHELVASALAGEVTALGDSYVPLDMPASSFAPGKPDGLAVYRTSHYVASCTCMRYDTPWMRVSRG